MKEKAISDDFPFESKFMEIDGSRMHYIDEGSGDPILFLHGNPTSSYLWRNIIPYLLPHGRCIAPDLIGMGKSDKPDIAYRFFDHAKYIERFIRALGLSNITLVIHNWGSALGFDYAMKHEENMKGIAFMEAMLRPMRWQDFPADFKLGFKLMRMPGIGWVLISVLNIFVRQILPKATLRKLSKGEKSNYFLPYKTIKSRRPVRRWPCEIPIDGEPADVHEMMQEYSQKLQTSGLPKILFSATPGGIINRETAEWCRQHLKNLKIVDIGAGIHYVQEDHPHKIGEELADWYLTI